VTTLTARVQAPARLRRQHRALRSLQVGPAVTTQGGIASVIEEVCGGSSEGLTSTAYPTWWPQSPARSLAAALALAVRLPLLRARYDVVHVHLSEGGSFVREGFVAVAAKALGFRTAATLHGADFPAFLANHPVLVRRVLGAADVVFCLGGRTRAAVEGIRPGRTALVSNPVQARPAPTLQGGGRPSVLFAGVLGERKGFDLLLAAWPAVRAQLPDAELHVAGPLGDVEAPPGMPGVVYHGLLTRPQVEELLATTSVACLPSRREVLPMFVLESLAAGVPVVASDAGELGELRECAAVDILPNPVDPGRLADALLDALTRDTPARRSAAYDWVSRNAFASRVIEDLRTAYERVGRDDGPRTHVPRPGEVLAR
jgi:glycosyltransferase involved in cell wall biosynthesis